MPYTDDLPLDLTCTVLTITSDDAAYEPLAAAAAQATQDAVQANVTSVTLYQTQFTSAGADYTLPAGTTPTITILTQNGAAITETTDAAGNTKATLATRTENTADPATSTDEGGEGTSSASEATDGEGSSSTAAEADTSEAATDGTSPCAASPSADASGQADQAEVPDDASGQADQAEVPDANTSAAADSTDPSAIVSEETNIMLLSLSEDDAGQITATDTQTAASIQLLSDTNTTAVVTYKEIITEFYKRVDTLAELAQYNDSSDKRYIIVFDNDSRMLVGNQETWDNSGGVDYYTIPVCVSPISDQSGETGYYTVLDLDTNSNVSAPISDPENGAYAKAHYAIDYPPKDTSKDYVFMHFAGLDLTSDKDWTQVLWLGTSGLFNYSTEFTFVEPTEDFGSWKAYVSASGIRYLACSNTDSVQPTTTDVDLEVDSEGNASSSSTYDSSHKSDYDSHVLSQYEVHSETDSSRTSEMGFKIYIYKGGSANYTLEIEYYDSAAEADKVQKIILTERIPEDQLPTDSTPSETHSSITGSTLISGTGEGSDATSLSNQLSGSTLTYASDATTSNIESEFSTSYNEETIKNDGRVLTDKSVEYGRDDYGIFDSYDPGEFSETLSAVGQSWDTNINGTAETPIDVVFILDLSGSMTDSVDSSSDSNARWVDTVAAVNSSINSIQARNSDNRVGVVCFSNAATTMLYLDRYTADDDEYLTYDSSSSSAHLTLQTADSIAAESGTAVTKVTATKSKGMWNGTYTQRGIQEAYKVLTEYNTEYTANVKFKDGHGNIVGNADGKEVARQPVYILLTDGCPTLSTPTYTDPLNGSSYGQALDYAAHGYYTILSANYFKDMASTTYGQAAYFFSVGMGISSEYHGNYLFENAVQAGTFTSSAAVDDAYARAIMNPTTANIKALTDDLPNDLPEEYNTLYYSSGAKRMTSINKLWARTSTFLYNLLMQNFTATGTTQSVGSGSYTGLGTTSSTIPLLTNSYYDSSDVENGYGYNYCDGAYFGQLSESDMTDILNEIVGEIQDSYTFSFLLDGDSKLTFTDQIGSGMMVTSTPVLRYYVGSADDENQSEYQNFTAKVLSSGKDDNDNSYIEYNFPYTTWRTYSDAKKKNAQVNSKFGESKDLDDVTDRAKVDLSSIVVRVTTDKNTGSQTVVYSIPDNLLPTYHPNLTLQTYYEELPVRLIFKVGINDSTRADIASSKSAINQVLYTNAVNGEGDTAQALCTVSFTPDASNKYYSKDSAADEDGTKTTSGYVSGVSATYFNETRTYNATSGSVTVTQTLGNNGRL